MEASASPPHQALQSTSVVDSVPDPIQDPLPPPLSTGSTVDDDSKPINSDEKTKKPRKKAKKRRISRDGPDLWPSSSSSCSSSPSSSLHPTRVVLRRRRPRALLAAPRRIECKVDSIALPLGMSVAAVVCLVRNVNLFSVCFCFSLGFLNVVSDIYFGREILGCDDGFRTIGKVLILMLVLFVIPVLSPCSYFLLKFLFIWDCQILN